ncbi:(NiFe) hydrogenase maturation protein HypF [Psychromonas ingrahamii 37]|uniref:Carbamoyltransferase HypF n=1 Tax=Psychromonas ingrahamii (strain DSM 17664 / CCUG 51855 / 37) TaxID=357804 RepID=A1SU85_PSYIN|nr:carbamoyltransferase HypF [Psychromonas ingrahamii]ABM03050.1 (NiFe) hydrogenase maturation protein HypF [Psychromonas ingrahamii 37]
MQQRYQISVQGRVQGVGFRPFVAVTAANLNLTGWVRNIRQSVLIEIQGEPFETQKFLQQLQSKAPALAKIEQLNHQQIDNNDQTGFHILESSGKNEGVVSISPDIGICEHCQKELFYEENRRYRYPFISCTQCGPRYSILQKLPFDRCHTTLNAFPMCEDCLAEYKNLKDRRFHAQGINCAKCGPQVSFINHKGERIAEKEAALTLAINALQAGKILAVKGLTGFHIMVDACNHQAVLRLRARKQRPEKPFALMYPQLSMVKSDCLLGEQEKLLLCSAIAPIVLLENKHSNLSLSPAIAPNNPYLGVMLAYTPLHQLICRAINKPLVVTSANRSGEPVCCDNEQALEQLSQLVDGFVMHDREIYQGLDDSIVKFVNHEPMLLRRARGYVPDYLTLDTEYPSIVALGGQLKNSIAISKGKRLYLSQYIGSLDNIASVNRHQRTQKIMSRLMGVTADCVACDLHPDYVTTQLAKKQHLPIISTQHHLAHLYAAMLEHQIIDQAFAVVWDGNGYGEDGTLWGGEFIAVTADKPQRVATFLPFKLPGGAAAIKEPRRVAVALLYEVYGKKIASNEVLKSLSPFELSTIKQLLKMISNNINSPLTSSAGRLFDGISSLLNLGQISSFEGEAAMRLEFAAKTSKDKGSYPVPVDFAVTPNIIDWRPMLAAIITDIGNHVSSAIIARRFHNSAAIIILKIAQHYGVTQILLTGGCFQNSLLIEITFALLQEQGIAVLWHKKLPANDASLCVGQIMGAYKARHSYLNKKQ